MSGEANLAVEARTPSMTVWLVTVGEPLPTDPGSPRLFRTGILAHALVARGHRVDWWTSTFDHFRKKQRYDDDTTIEIEPGLRIHLIRSLGYSSNVSLRRIADHVGLAKGFRRLSRFEPTPDVILCSMPTIELSLEATRFGRRHGVPVVLDVRDLWPDIFVDVAPPLLRPAVRVVLAPYFSALRRACGEAAAITSITPGILDWALGRTGRARTAWDRDFPFGYADEPPTEAEIREAYAFWESYAICPGRERFVASFFGTLGRQFELDTVIRAARIVATQGEPISVAICGDGDMLEAYRSMAADCPNVVFPGWIGRPAIWTLLRLSSVGLAPYRSTEDFRLSLPNKSIEYLSAGLPIVTSLKGALEDLVTSNGCGVVYSNNDPVELAQALLRLVRSPAQVAEMGRRALSLYRERFVADDVYGRMCSYLEQVGRAFLGNRTSGRGGVDSPAPGS